MMDVPRNDGQEAAPCCADGQPCDRGPGSVAVSCDCGAPPRWSWLRTLISVVILLSAVGVGAYALTRGRTTGAASAESRKSTSPPAATSATTPAAPMPAAPSCCGGGANRAAQPQPQATCCGGGVTAAP